MENEPNEQEKKQRREDLVALDRLASQFVASALLDVMNKGKCDMNAEVTVKVTLKLTKLNTDEKS